MNRHSFLAALHERLAPRTYLEVGVNTGLSLALSRTPSIGVDPEFVVHHEIQCDAHLARTSSDEFFARRRPLAHLPLDVLDLVFVDGMHLSEYVLRDFLSVERFTHPGSVVVLDDMLPRNVEEASRVRTTARWTGDVYKALAALREKRPDLTVVEVATAGTGVGVVLGPDATRGGVLPGYDDWLEQAVSPDPQDVPAEVLGRTRAWDPEELLALAVWDRIVDLRALPRDRATREVGGALAALREPARVSG